MQANSLRSINNGFIMQFEEDFNVQHLLHTSALANSTFTHFLGKHFGKYASIGLPNYDALEAFIFLENQCVLCVEREREGLD